MNRSLEGGWCAVGEIGLGGEVRHVQQMDKRIHEATRLGFRNIICPKTREKGPRDANLVQVGTLSQAIEVLG